MIHSKDAYCSCKITLSMTGRIRMIVFFAGCPYGVYGVQTRRVYRTKPNHVSSITVHPLRPMHPCLSCTCWHESMILQNVLSVMAVVNVQHACLFRKARKIQLQMTVDEILNKLETQMLFSIIQAAAWRIQAANAQPSRILADLVNQVYDMGLNQPWKQAGIWLETVKTYTG